MQGKQYKFILELVTQIKQKGNTHSFSYVRNYHYGLGICRALCVRHWMSSEEYTHSHCLPWKPAKPRVRHPHKHATPPSWVKSFLHRKLWDLTESEEDRFSWEQDCLKVALPSAWGTDLLSVEGPLPRCQGRRTGRIHHSGGCTALRGFWNSAAQVPSGHSSSLQEELI